MKINRSGEKVKSYHNKNINQTFLDIGSREGGLTEQEVIEREHTRKSGDLEGKKHGLVSRFFEQFYDLMIVILLVASVVSITIGIVEKTVSEIIDGLIILLIVLMNAIFGVAQEYKAEKSLEALNKLTEPECYVKRDGKIERINTKLLVLGDVVMLEAGTILPADLRLIETHKLKIDESSLTGESYEVEKNAQSICSENAPLGERFNMGYRGTVVGCGRGMGVVVALGEDTELGKIASSIKEAQKELTPLQKSIKDVSKILTYLVLGVAIITFLIEIFCSPLGLMDAFLTAVAISVAAIPESMPAVITIIMSLGVARLAKKKAIVRQMHSVETLGCCDVICSDKTGTITQNKMTVKSVYFDNKIQNIKSIKNAKYLSLSALLCNDTIISKGKITGDPTEVALSELGKDLGLNKEELQKTFPRIKELPFDSSRKLMSVMCDMGKEKVVFTKGAPDNLLRNCDKILIDGNITPLTDDLRKKIIDANEEMSKKALRVIGFAFKPCGYDENITEDYLVFLGLMGMIDPPRKEIKDAVKKCRRAGMRPIMITGDYAVTALAVAREIGLATREDEVMSGSELSKLSDSQLEEKIKNVSVFARVSPQDKERIVIALKKQGHVVAMTGDGVNDAPSLKRASIGIGMGQSGTDIAKEVSDIIITDDNFATIVVAVEEGRKIYGNIQKTVKFLFSANLAELLSLFLITLIFPQNVFLFPVQILFVNLITDSLPAIALGVEEPETSLMESPPRDKKKGLFSNGIGVSIIVLGIVQTFLVMMSYIIGLKFDQNIAVTMAFYTLNIIQMFYLASMRTNAFIYKSKPHKNKFFFLAIGFCFALTALFAFTPLRGLLGLSVLTAGQWGTIFGLSVIMLLASEIYKLCEKLYRRLRKKKKFKEK